MMVTIGNFWFRYRNALFPVLFLGLLMIARPSFPMGDPGYDRLLDLLGLAVALSGQALRILTIGYDYIKRGGSQGKVYADNLVSGGVFAHARNPLYVGNILIFVGMAIVLNSWVGYLVGVPLALFIYSAIVAAEENYLRGKFGAEYDEYCGRVNRWWPNWRGFSRSIQEMEFNWRRVLVKEYNTTFAWLLSCVGLLIWENYWVQGDQAGPGVWHLAYLLIPLIAAYLTVLILKKTRRI